MPLQWATAQNNLGLALATLGERGSGTERLEQAVTAHRNAIAMWQQSTVPEDWVRSTRTRVAHLEAHIATRRASKA